MTAVAARPSPPPPRPRIRVRLPSARRLQREIPPRATSRFSKKIRRRPRISARRSETGLCRAAMRPPARNALRRSRARFPLSLPPTTPAAASAGTKTTRHAHTTTRGAGGGGSLGVEVSEVGFVAHALAAVLPARRGRRGPVGLRRDALPDALGDFADFAVEPLEGPALAADVGDE